jgi:hypothetical protein
MLVFFGLTWMFAHRRLCFGVDNLDELTACLARPLSEAEQRFLATRDRILARRNPAQLVEDALWCERIDRVVEAVMGAGG